jgi:hypothetical protein
LGKATGWTRLTTGFLCIARFKSAICVLREPLRLDGDARLDTLCSSGLHATELLKHARERCVSLSSDISWGTAMTTGKLLLVGACLVLMTISAANAAVPKATCRGGSADHPETALQGQVTRAG